ncbi:hypothetical protein CALVIDRAFT_289877 [Calocera viscosa TUFC12733]|uniref:Uncharacterized protein n=1 Tax=Calocera viscosa (strain TUFC12733) TaxID=1330018 RepID=A0A167IPZ8_CALVF|nr:hypothetical protein CALVIDRAFT_289877 [Calocera viscosa TUFC12733]
MVVAGGRGVCRDKQAGGAELEVWVVEGAFFLLGLGAGRRRDIVCVCEHDMMTIGRSECAVVWRVADAGAEGAGETATQSLLPVVWDGADEERGSALPRVPGGSTVLASGEGGRLGVGGEERDGDGDCVLVCWCARDRERAGGRTDVNWG